MYAAAASRVDTLSALCAIFASYQINHGWNIHIQNDPNVVHTLVDCADSLFLGFIVLHLPLLTPRPCLFSKRLCIMQMRITPFPTSHFHTLFHCSHFRCLWHNEKPSESRTSVCYRTNIHSTKEYSSQTRNVLEQTTKSTVFYSILLWSTRESNCPLLTFLRYIMKTGLDARLIVGNNTLAFIGC